MLKIDLERIDKEYVVERVNNELYSVMKKSRNNLGFGNNLGISKVLEEIKSKNQRKCFDVRNYESAYLEEFIVVAKLNDEVKAIPTTYDVLIFGNLHHYINKEPISYPEDYNDFRYFIDGKEPVDQVSIANQVLFLAPEEARYKDLIEYWRRKLVQILKYGKLEIDIFGEL